MVTSEARERLAVVLVGARNPQNIGAVARAMQDFGFTDLRVVNEFTPPFEAAQLEAKSAVAAGDVMRSARLYNHLPEAIADCTLVAGTTAIGGRGLEEPVSRLADVAMVIRQGLAAAAAPDEREQAGKVALLFGSEKTGLTNEQLSFCSVLLTIPMFAPPGCHLSMNLGQAVAVCLYELVRDGFQGSRNLSEVVSVSPDVALRERVLASLRHLMETSGYARRFPANARVEVVRRLGHQLGTTREEASTWLGFLKHLSLRSEKTKGD